MASIKLGTKRIRTRTGYSVAAVVVCLVASAGCGGGEGDDAPRAQHKLTQADNALARRLVFTWGDFSSAGGSWTRSLDKDDQGAGSKCTSKAIKSLTVTGQVDSGTFSEGDGSAQAYAKPSVFEDNASADKAYSLVATDETMRCIAKQLKAVIAKDSTTKDVKVGDVSTGALASPNVGEQSRGYRLGLNLESSGINLTYNVDLIVASSGRAVVFALFADVGTFNQDLEKSLLGKLRERMSSVASA